MMAICRLCAAARNVRLPRGSHIRDYRCPRCGQHSLGAAHAIAPKVWRDRGLAWCYAAGAEAATQGMPSIVPGSYNFPQRIEAYEAGYASAYRGEETTA